MVSKGGNFIAIRAGGRPETLLRFQYETAAPPRSGHALVRVFRTPLLSAGYFCVVLAIPHCNDEPAIATSGQAATNRDS